MAHHTVRSAYKNLVERLNQFPQGAPPSELLYKILEILFSPEEAEFVASLSIKPFTAEKAAALTGKPLNETIKMLEGLADKGLLLDNDVDGQPIYVLPPPMAGFFEFSMMRIRNDIDQSLLAELFYEYLNVEEDFVKDLFTSNETKLGRVFVNEEVLMKTPQLSVLDYEKASEIIKTASHIGIGVCYCRHKMEHLGKACDAPMEICMTFNNVADSLIQHKIARQADVPEALDLLQLAIDRNLVQFGENVRESVNFICHCCGCCCEALLAAKRFGFLHPVATTNFIPEIDVEKCNGCGQCARICPVEAIKMKDNNSGSKHAELTEDICLGCAVCIKNCRQDAMCLKARAEKVITPLNSTHRVVLSAIEKGKLQNLIFDNQAMLNHRVMAAILGVIVKLPPVKRAMASEQFRSRYLEQLISKHFS